MQLPVWSTNGDELDFGHLQNPETPSSRMFSTVKTPQCLHITPGMLHSVNRQALLSCKQNLFHFVNPLYVYVNIHTYACLFRNICKFMSFFSHQSCGSYIMHKIMQIQVKIFTQNVILRMCKNVISVTLRMARFQILDGCNILEISF